MTRPLGLDAASALVAFKTTVRRSKNDALNGDLARHCAYKAWHLCDHVFEALSSNSPFTGKADLQDHVRHNCPEVAYLQDICIESKHGKISRYVPHIDETRHHAGDFSRDDFDCRDFDVSRLEIKLPDGQTVLFDDTVDRSVDFGRNSSTSTGSSDCQRRSKISPPGRSKTSPLNVMRYAVLGGCPGSP